MKKAISLFVVLSMVIMSLGGITLVGSAEVADTINLTIDGVETEFTTIATANEFSEKIVANPSGNFALISDIALNQKTGAYAPVETFSGMLVGVNADGTAEEVRTITATASGVSTGLFVTVSGATVRNIKLAGAVDDSKVQYTGGFASKGTGAKSTFVNCENAARIYASGGYGAAGTAGFIAYMDTNSSGVDFINCVNSGSVTFNRTDKAGNTAGFVGITENKGAIALSFTNCVNTGVITGNASVAGFVGKYRKVSVVNSSNRGAISAIASGAGLLGTSYSSPVSGITASYNMADVTVTTGTAGGLASGVSGKITITDSYNCGIITGTTVGKLVGSATESVISTSYDATNSAGVLSNATTLTYKDCYYLSEDKVSDEQGTDAEGKDNTTALTSAEMTVADNFAGFDFTTDEKVWAFNGIYSYPQIIGNYQPFAIPKLETPVAKVEYFEATDSYVVNWNSISGAAGYTLTLTDAESVATTVNVAENTYSVPETLLNNIYSATLVAESVYGAEGNSAACEFILNTCFANNEAPYIIKNVRQFKNIAKDLTAEYHLANDITLDQVSGDYTLINAFAGKLIGVNSDGVEDIRTIDVNAKSSVVAGVFNSVAGATVKNIRITGSLEGTGGLHVGGISAIASGASQFINCHNEASITSSGSYAGGIIADSNGGSVTFINCSNTGNIVGGTHAGGIAGRAKTVAKVEFCYNGGSIQGGQNVGGLIGYSNNYVKIYNSFSSAELGSSSKTESSVGGLVGKVQNTATIETSYAEGEIITSFDGAITGNIVGSAGAYALTNCYYLSETEGEAANGQKPLTAEQMKNEQSFAGFDFESVWTMNEENAEAVKYYYPQLVSNMYTPVIDMGNGTEARPYLIYTADDFTRVMTEAQTATEIVYVELKESITLGTEEAPYTPFAFTGVFNGNNNSVTYYIASEASSEQGLFSTLGAGSKISNLTVSGTIDCPNSPSAGGVVGAATGITEFTGIVSNVNIKISAEGNNGGIIGRTITNTTIKDCIYNGTIQRGAYAGGILGWMNGGAASISGCVNNGTVVYASYAGGIAAHVRTSRIENCVNNGSLESGTAAGGIVGLLIKNDHTIENCKNYGKVYNRNANGRYAGGIVGRSETEKTLNVIDCINAGIVEVKAGNSGSGILGYAAKGVNNISGCINLAPVFSAGEYMANPISASDNVSIKTDADTYVSNGETLNYKTNYYLTADVADEKYDDGIEATVALTKEDMAFKTSEVSDFYLVEVSEVEEGIVECEGKKFYARKGNELVFDISGMGDYNKVSANEGAVEKTDYQHFTLTYIVKEADAVITVSLEIPEFNITTPSVYGGDINFNEMVYFRKKVFGGARLAENAEIVCAEFSGTITTADEYGFVFSKDEIIDENDTFIPSKNRQAGVFFYGQDTEAVYYVGGYIKADGVTKFSSEFGTFNLRNIK